MEKLEKRVKKALESAFEGIDVNLERMQSGRVTGSVIWEGFDPYDDVTRQKMIWEVLDEKLKDDTAQVSILLAYTPDEIESMSAA